MIRYTLLTMLASLIAAAELPAANMPNVVLILVDDLGWTDLACQGSRFYETPHLDRLAFISNLVDCGSHLRVGRPFAVEDDLYLLHCCASKCGWHCTSVRRGIRR